VSNGTTRKVPRKPYDPFMSFRFRVLVDGDIIGGFSDVTGLGAETEVQPLRVGGFNDAEVMLAGPTKYASRLILKRGLGHPALLWNWYLGILRGTIKRKLVKIELRWDARPIGWTFQETCPVKWIGPELHAGTSAVAFESIELVHNGLLLSRV
jgi:phage tail-like protein